MNKISFYLFICLFNYGIVGYAQNNVSVPVPWTPLQIKQNNHAVNIECWGRKYIFNGSLLPSQIYSQGIPLLNKPITFKLGLNKKAVQFDPALIKVISKTNAFIEIESVSKSKKYSFGIIQIMAKIHIEYDGLMVISLTTKYPANFKPDLFNIEIPYNSEVSKYYMKWVNRINQTYSGGLPSKDGILLQSDFTPYFWIGDNYKGLFWFCESTQNWPNAQKSTAIQIIRQANTIVQRFNLGYTNAYEFGIQATPVKPLLNNWRDFRFFPAINSNIVIPWPNPGKPSSVKYYGWPEAVNDNNYNNLIKKYHSNNKLVLPYVTITMLPSLSPVYQKNKAQWLKGETSMKLKADNLIYIDPNSKNYKETISQQLAYYFKKYNLDGYYFDATKLYSYSNNNHKIKYYPILAYRKLQQTLYDSIKSKNPKALLIAHMSGNMVIPVLSFVDGYVDGEQFRSSNNGKRNYKVKESYLDFINLDQFRIEFMGKQWGIIPFFLPEFDPATKKNIQPTLGLTSLLLVHDVQPWPVFSNVSIWNQMYNALDSFGFKNSTFIPYYDAKPPCLINNLNGVYISAYKKENQVLLIVSNLSKTRMQGQITLNNPVLDMKKINSIYSFDKAPVHFTENKILVDLDPLSYKLFWLK